MIIYAYFNLNQLENPTFRKALEVGALRFTDKADVEIMFEGNNYFPYIFCKLANDHSITEFINYYKKYCYKFTVFI